MAIVLDGTAGITTPDLTDTSLTSGRVVYAGTSGNLTGSTNLTFDGSNLICGGTLQALGTVQSSSGADLSLNANGVNRDVIVKVNGTEQARFVGSTSVLSIISGIKFPATQSASSDANTLDDYEEGTWTPSLGGNTTYTTQAGYYTKVGRVVFIQASIIVNTLGTGSTTTISGFPFQSQSVNAGKAYSFSVSYFGSLAVNCLYLVGGMLGVATTMDFNSNNTSGATFTSFSTAVFGNSTRIDFSGTYLAVS
jgi:hypothetical protein